MDTLRSQAIRILLVEDNPADVRVTQETLKKVQLSTHLDVVGDGTEAMAFLRKHDPYLNARRPDIILLDLHLPRKTGFEVLDELQQDTTLQDIPVAVCLASPGDRQRLDQYNLPADCFFIKSYDPDQLTRVLTRCPGTSNGSPKEHCGA
jgi:two-component system, chemotaxis family, response regulator Rcp1